MIFDDGSTISDDGTTSTASPMGLLPGDVYDTAQMAPFIAPAAAKQGMQWWEGVAMYGITRAIDNRFGPVNVAGNTQAGSFAGQNGRTYTNGRPGTAPASAAGIPWALVLGGVALAWFAFK